MKSSLDPLADLDLSRAEAALHRGQARFHSVRACLRWAFRAASNLQDPLPDAIRRHARSGPQLRVDGGSGSSIEDVFADLATVQQALSMLAHVDGGAIMVQLLHLAYEEGCTQTEIEKKTQKSQQWISTQLSRAEWFMLPLLMQAELVDAQPVRQAKAAG